MLGKIEALFFFLAKMLAIVLEGGIVYWIFQHPAGSGTSFSLTGHWTGAALPQAWLFGALCMLVCRLTAIFISPLNDAAEDVRVDRKAFLRLWRWTIALIAIQSLSIFLDCVAGS
jgi:hypothetical protein